MNFFLTTVLAGAVLTQLQQLLNTSSPLFIVNILAVNIPIVSTQLLNYVLLQTFIVLPLSVLNPVALLVGRIKQHWLSPVTERDISSSRDTVALSYGTQAPQDLLIFIIGCSYACVSPFVVPFVLAFAVMAYTCNKYLLLYCVEVPRFDTGGMVSD